MSKHISYPPHFDTSSFSTFETPSFYPYFERSESIISQKDVTNIIDPHILFYIYLNDKKAFQVYYDPSDDRYSVGIMIYGSITSYTLPKALIPSVYKNVNIHVYQNDMVDHSFSLIFESVKDAVDFYNSMLSIHQRVYE